MFSPDSKILASGDIDFTIILWNVSNWTVIASLKPYHGSVYSIAFTGDSRTLAAGLAENIVSLWDI